MSTKIRLVIFCIGIIMFMQNVCGQETSEITGIGSFSSSSELVSDSLSIKEIEERMQVIRKMLEHNEKKATGWWYSWIGIYSGATLGQGAIAYITENKQLRQDMIVSAGTTLIGFAGQLVFPVKTDYDNEQFGKFNDLSKKENLEKLRQAEFKLKYQAERAKSGKNWQTHAMNGAVNLAGGLITCLCFKRPFLDGLESFAIGMAISEIQIWTQPTRAMKDYRQYCNKYGLNGTNMISRPEFVWYAHVSPGGLSVGIGF